MAIFQVQSYKVSEFKVTLLSFARLGFPKRCGSPMLI